MRTYPHEKNPPGMDSISQPRSIRRNRTGCWNCKSDVLTPAGIRMLANLMS